MKALVLASGGVDSTTCLGLAVNKYGKENVIALTVAYGQKHTKEIEAARKAAEGNRWITSVNLCAVSERIISFLSSKHCAVKKLQCDLLRSACG